MEESIKKKYYGIRRIPDTMALIEMEAYKPGVNVDRLVSLAALVAFAKIRAKSIIFVENGIYNMCCQT